MKMNINNSGLIFGWNSVTQATKPSIWHEPKIVQFNLLNVNLLRAKTVQMTKFNIENDGWRTLL